MQHRKHPTSIFAKCCPEACGCVSQNSTALSQTISPIDELSMANSSQQQCYTSDYFNSILGSTTATTAGFDLTAQGSCCLFLCQVSFFCREFSLGDFT